MKVSLVGAGPGDPGLLTLRGRDLIAEADVIVYDALADPTILQHAKPEAELIYAGKIADAHTLPQTGINELLAAKALENKNVVRLKGGDPYIFGRGGEEAEYLVDRDIPFEEVPGVTSAIAAPSYAGIPLTQRHYTSSLTIVTGHENPDKADSAINWQSLAQSGSTIVFVMGMKNLPLIAANLIKAGMPVDTPAALIYRGTTPQQRSLFSTLEKLPQDAIANKFTNPSVIVIGSVCDLHSKLDWFSKKPLLGRTIVVTRARAQGSGLVKQLSDLGARVIECPSIKIEPLADYGACDIAISKLQDYDWLILTSANGVQYFWQRLAAAGKDSRALANCKVAAIGPATANALAGKGILADLVPDAYVAENVAQAIIEREGKNIAGKRILIARAAEARMVLPDELAKAGAIVDVVPVYRTVPDCANVETVKSLLEAGEVDCISFASSSTVRNFLNLIPANLLQNKTALAAIGPITANEIKSHGLTVTIEPEEYTIPALVKAIVNHFSTHIP